MLEKNEEIMQKVRRSIEQIIEETEDGALVYVSEELLKIIDSAVDMVQDKVDAGRTSQNVEVFGGKSHQMPH